MNSRQITKQSIECYREELIREEKSCVTIEKYIRDLQCFLFFLKERPIMKETMILYKQYLQEKNMPFPA